MNFVEFLRTPFFTENHWWLIRNVHKKFRRRPGRLLNVLCTFNLRPVSRGIVECGNKGGYLSAFLNASYLHPQPFAYQLPIFHPISKWDRTGKYMNSPVA